MKINIKTFLLPVEHINRTLNQTHPGGIQPSDHIENMLDQHHLDAPV